MSFWGKMNIVAHMPSTAYPERTPLRVSKDPGRQFSLQLCYPTNISLKLRKCCLLGMQGGCSKFFAGSAKGSQAVYDPCFGCPKYLSFVRHASTDWHSTKGKVGLIVIHHLDGLSRKLAIGDWLDVFLTWSMFRLVLSGISCCVGS